MGLENSKVVYFRIIVQFIQETCNVTECNADVSGEIRTRQWISKGEIMSDEGKGKELEKATGNKELEGKHVFHERDQHDLLYHQKLMEGWI